MLITKARHLHLPSQLLHKHFPPTKLQFHPNFQYPARTMSQVLRYQATKQGGPFELVKSDKPAIEDDAEVLVKLKAVALQPIDWKMLQYGFMVESWPHMFGVDGAGVVEAVGKGVSNLKAGDNVLGFFGGGARSATHQEYAVAKESSLAKTPQSLSFEDAASMPVAYITGAAALYDGLDIPLPFLAAYGGPKDGFKPKSIMVLGGSSSVGSATIQLLRVALPDAVIFTTSSLTHHNKLKAFGADKTFDRSASVDEIKASTPGGKGVDAIVDAVNGAAMQPSLLDIFDPSGPKKLAEVMTGGNLDKVPEGIKHSVIVLSTIFAKPGGQGVIPALGELVAAGKFKTPTDVKIVGEGFEAISEGLKELQAGVSGTKLVVKL